MKRIALIELMPYHSETLYAQLQFLRSRSYSPILICNEKLKNIVEGFRPNDIQVHYINTHSLKGLWNVRQLLKGHDINTAILNTAQGSIPLKFALLPLPRAMKVFGTIHETHKLTDSKGQQIISMRMDGYYVLAEYIDHNFPLDKKKHTWFSPAFYPNYPCINLREKKGTCMWITIPGAIEHKRRDYDSLLTLAQHTALPEKVRFVLLGNAQLGEGPEFIEQIKKNKLEKRFIWFDQRVPNAEFYSYIQHTDYLIPLIHPNTRAATEYCRSKISGMFPLSSAFGIRLLCHNMFEQVSGFDYPALFYADFDQLVQLLDNDQTITYKADKSIDFDTEAQRYISLLK